MYHVLTSFDVFRVVQGCQLRKGRLLIFFWASSNNPIKNAPSPTISTRPDTKKRSSKTSIRKLFDLEDQAKHVPTSKITQMNASQLASGIRGSETGICSRASPDPLPVPSLFGTVSRAESKREGTGNPGFITVLGGQISLNLLIHAARYLNKACRFGFWLPIYLEIA
jgi:hypothetical protein